MYHFYNNTNLYVTFRNKYLKDITSKQLGNQMLQELAKEGTEGTFNMSGIRVKKLYPSYVVIEMSSLNELKPAADILSKRQEVLGLEWLQKKRLFGVRADLDEMASFKTKIKRQEQPKGQEDNKDNKKAKKTESKNEL